MKRQQDHLIFKISLLSVSIFLMMAPQIASALPLMYHAFPGVGRAGVETLSTIPNLGIMVGLLISPLVIRYLHEKKTIILGLVLVLIAGTFPMYSQNYNLILASRFVLGAGIGLFNSLAVSLIPQLYRSSEDELATMVGYQNVMGNVGAAIASFLLSYLVLISWHAAFAIYLLAIPVLILFTMFVPLKEPKKVDKGQHEANKQHINRSVILIAVILFWVFTFYLPMSYKLPALVVQSGMGSASSAALLAGFSTLISIPIGISFGYFFKKMHDHVFPIGTGLSALGFILISISSNIWFLFFSVLVLGFGFGLAVPYLYNWLDWSAPADSVNLATTVVLVMVNIGCFLSPMIVNLVGSIIGSDTPQTVMVISAVANGLLFVYAVVHYVHVHRQAAVAAETKNEHQSLQH